MDFGIGLLVIPIVVGILVAALRMGLSPAYEAPFAMLVGLAIFAGYAAATQVPGGGAFAEAALRGLAIGLTSAGLVAAVRRLSDERRVRKARWTGGRRRRQRGAP